MGEGLGVVSVLGWALCWLLGGWWLTRAAFKLRLFEEGAVGLIVGLTAEIGLSNFLVRVLPLPAASWTAALIVLAAGLILALRSGGWRGLKVRVQPGQILLFLAVSYMLYITSRGLALYDDYAHLPTLSIMATGEVPPRFPTNPGVFYYYHYFVLLFGAQIMALSGTLPWTAWDLARSLTVAPAILLGGLWAYRVTRSRTAAVLGGLGVVFLSGTRWLLLLIPDRILGWISPQVPLIGAGAAAGSTLMDSLANPWPVDGQGSFPFPFAFENGLYVSGVEVVHNVIGLMLPAVLFTLLLTASRWRSKWAVMVSILLVSSLGLITEIEILLIGAALVLLALAAMIRNRSFKLPGTLAAWLLVWGVSGVIIAVQGGAWTEMVISLATRLSGQPAPASYQVTGLKLALPSIVSNQLGILSLLNIQSIIAALFEMGPLLLVLPLAAVWGWKAARAGRWFEASLCIGGVMSLLMVFVHFSGSVRNTSRLYYFLQVCALMAVPLTWLWATRRKLAVKQAVSVLAGVVLFGGLVMLGVQLPNIKNHQFSFFITPNDAAVTGQYWNQLEPGALVFDPVPHRATTIFGRHTDAGYTFYEFKPEFMALVDNPDVQQLVKMGFSYAYLDKFYWQDLFADEQKAFLQPCVSLLHEEFEEGDAEGWRRLYDIRSCKN